MLKFHQLATQNMACPSDVQETSSLLNQKTPMNNNEIQELNEKTEEEKKEERMIKPWDCGSPLYDSHEVVSISHVLERNFMVLPYLSGSRTTKESSVISSSSFRLESKMASGSSKIKRSSMVKFFKDLLEGNLWKKKKKNRNSPSPNQRSSSKSRRTTKGCFRFPRA